MQGCLGLYLVTGVAHVRSWARDGHDISPGVHDHLLSWWAIVARKPGVSGGCPALSEGIVATVRHTRDHPVAVSVGVDDSIVGGRGDMIQSDVAKAKTFCDTLLPELYAMQTQTGVYPADLSKLDAYTNPPRIMRQGGVVYRVTSDGKHFRFTIHDGVTVAGRWVFTG